MVAPVYQPVSAATDPVAPDEDVHEWDVPPGQALSHSVRKAKGLLEKADQGLRRGEAISAERQELAELRRVVATLDAEVRAEFERTGLLLAEREVPASIKARHDETFARYREEVQALLADLASIETETDEELVTSTIERAFERLSQQKHRPSQQPFDPNQLPHEAQRPAVDNHPRTTREEFLGAGLLDTPLVQLAAIEGYRLDGLPGADDPAYLGESTEVRLSPEVHAKAAKLNHDPVEIYHWVRNQVEWLPTWGAVQDADLTLSARRGNAMDTASLLISLLRASGIPARYVHGTIEVPEEAFRNWAGGFEHIEEAMNYAASGGIPLTGLIEGGSIAHVRMEHVWVEAAVDFLPSRGAVMREADTWLPLDPSFKQYEFLSALD
ncbi:MAG: transglutaminase domain-containing protein, partial [Thioalkalivibrio sp.]